MRELLLPGCLVGRNIHQQGQGVLPAPGRGKGCKAFPFPQPPKLPSVCAELMKFFLLSALQEGFFIFFPAWNSVSSRFPAESAGIGWRWRGAALPRSPKVLGEIPQFIFPGCRMPFPLHSSARRYFITMFPIHMSGHFTRVRAP